MIYLYDGSYYGMLTCIFNHYYVQKADEIYPETMFLGSLIDVTKFIETNEEQAIRVESAISEKFTEVGYMDMYRTFLSNEMNKDCYILAYLIQGFKIGNKIDRLYSEPYVIKIRELSRKVGFEAHRFTGLLRFVEKKPFLLATFEPDNDILPLIADHFADRFKNEYIIIHDVKRNKAVFAQDGEWVIYEGEVLSELTIIKDAQLSQKETLLQELWKGYFEHIGIEGRKNLKLQQSFVPLKYRKHILEFHTK